MSKNKKKVKKNFKKFILCLVIVGLIIGGYFAYNKFYKKEDVSKPKVVDEIKKFNYVVNENDTKLFKSIFSDLKKTLSKKEVDNKEYAKDISKLFIVDFFTLDNKTSKNDVGGVQFVYESYKSDFVDYARDGMYKQVVSIIDGNKRDKLPEVTKIDIDSIDEVDASSIFESSDFDSDDKKKAFEIKLKWEYKNGSDFQTSATVTVVKDKDKLSIAKMEE